MAKPAIGDTILRNKHMASDTLFPLTNSAGSPPNMVNPHRVPNCQGCFHEVSPTRQP